MHKQSILIKERGEKVIIEYNPKESSWEKPGYKDEGWVVYIEGDQYNLYEFDYGPETYYNSYTNLNDAVNAAETELT